MTTWRRLHSASAFSSYYYYCYYYFVIIIIIFLDPQYSVLIIITYYYYYYYYGIKWKPKAADNYVVPWRGLCRQISAGALKNRCRVRSCWRPLRGTRRTGCTTAGSYGVRRSRLRRRAARRPSAVTTWPCPGRTGLVGTRDHPRCLWTLHPACTELSTTDLYQYKPTIKLQFIRQEVQIPT